MSNKNNTLAIILIIIAIGLIGAGGFLSLKATTGQSSTFSLEKLYVIEANEMYGVIGANGQIIVQPQYSKIARINDIVYLKSAAGSYLYDLSSRKLTNLDGMESDIFYAKNETVFLDKYVLQYGASQQDYVYKVIDSTGTSLSEKDFTSKEEAYSFLGITSLSSFIPKKPENTTVNSKNVTATLTYPTQEGKTQYIIKETANSKTKYGIVDETGKKIVNAIYDSMSQANNSGTACLATKDGISYVLLNDGTIIEASEGFSLEYSSDGYIIQKRGTTGNKIYNLKGDVVVNKIFTYPANVVTLKSKTANYLLLQDEKTTLWNIYNSDTLESLNLQISNLAFDYLVGKDTNIINSSIIYKTATGTVGIELDTFTAFNIASAYNVVAPLESGFKIGK